MTDDKNTKDPTQDTSSRIRPDIPSTSILVTNSKSSIPSSNENSGRDTGTTKKDGK